MNRFIEKFRIELAELANYRGTTGFEKTISYKSICLLLGAFDKTTWIGMRNFIITALFWALGLRAGELAAIKLKDTDFNYDSAQHIAMLKIHGKGRKERTLFIVDRLYAELVDYLKYPELPKKKSDALVNMRSVMRPLTTHRMRQIIKEMASKAGITERITPHLFRHTFATDLYHKNVPVAAIMDILGHDSIADTSHYIHVSEKLKATALCGLSVKRRMS